MLTGKTRATCLIALMLSVQPVTAETIKFVPRGWMGVMDYTFIQSPRKTALPDGSDFPEVKFDAMLLIAGLGLTGVYRDFYLDASYQDSTEEQDTFHGGGYTEKFNGDRRDYSFTAGMRILNNRGNVYIGYKDGKTSGRGEHGTRLTFREQGFFIGASYGWLIQDKGFLVINAAYADLDGNLNEMPGPRYPAGLGMDADSNAQGLSYGVSWNGRVSGKMGYSISLDANEYDFKDLKDKYATRPLPDKVEESIYTARFTLSYRF